MLRFLLVILAISTTFGQNQRQQHVNFANGGNPSIHNNQGSHSELVQNPQGHHAKDHASTRILAGNSGSSLVPQKVGTFGQPGFHRSSNFNNPNQGGFNGHSGFSQNGQEGPLKRPHASINSFSNGHDRFQARPQNSGGLAPPRQQTVQNRPSGSGQQFGLSEFDTGNHNQPPFVQDSGRTSFPNQRPRSQPFGIPGRVPEKAPTRIPTRAIILTEDDLDEDSHFAFVEVPSSRRNGISSGAVQPNRFSNQGFDTPGEFRQGNIGHVVSPFSSDVQHGSTVSHRFPSQDPRFSGIKVVQQPRPVVGRPTIVQILRKDDFEHPEPPEEPERPVFLVDSFGRRVAEAKFEELDVDRFERPSFERRPIPNRFNPNGNFGAPRRPELVQVQQQSQIDDSFGNLSARKNLGGHSSSRFERPTGGFQGPRHHGPSQNRPPSHFVDGFGNPVPGNSFTGVRPSSGRHN